MLRGLLLRSSSSSFPWRFAAVLQGSAHWVNLRQGSANYTPWAKSYSPWPKFTFLPVFINSFPGTSSYPLIYILTKAPTAELAHKAENFYSLALYHWPWNVVQQREELFPSALPCPSEPMGCDQHVQSMLPLPFSADMPEWRQETCLGNTHWNGGL